MPVAVEKRSQGRRLVLEWDAAVPVSQRADRDVAHLSSDVDDCNGDEAAHDKFRMEANF